MTADVRKAGYPRARAYTDYADTGAIIAAMGLKETFTGDTLSESTQQVILESIRFPEPVFPKWPSPIQ